MAESLDQGGTMHHDEQVADSYERGRQHATHGIVYALYGPFTRERLARAAARRLRTGEVLGGREPRAYHLGVARALRDWHRRAY